MIRAAKPDDEPAIAAVHVASWHETYSGALPDAVIAHNTLEKRERLWRRVLNEGTQRVFVADDAAGTVVGFVCGGPMPALIRGRPPIPEHDGYVAALYILAKMHGRGIGRALMRTLALYLSDRGYRSLALHVVAENPARRFYERLGARFIHAEPLAEGIDEGVQLAYGWDDITALLQ